MLNKPLNQRGHHEYYINNTLHVKEFWYSTSVFLLITDKKSGKQVYCDANKAEEILNNN